MYNNHMLIADDDGNILNIYRQIFTGENFLVHTFEDGIYLLEYFHGEYKSGNKIPLCILDMRMNILDGMETARAFSPIFRKPTLLRNWSMQCSIALDASIYSSTTQAW